MAADPYVFARVGCQVSPTSRTFADWLRIISPREALCLTWLDLSRAWNRPNARAVHERIRRLDDDLVAFRQALFHYRSLAI